MCELCEFMLSEEHAPEMLARAQEFPCPKCKVFAAGSELPSPRRRKGKGPRRKLKPRYQPCYHCWTKENLHEECPICKLQKVQ